MSRKPDSMVLDPDDPFEAAVIKMVQTNRSKREDYAGDSHIFQNFYDSAYQLSQTAGHSVEALISTKQARLRVLLQEHWNATGKKPNNEGIEDTLLDRAVYSVISMCLWDEYGYDYRWKFNHSTE